MKGRKLVIVGSRRQKKLHMYRPESAVLTLQPLLSPGMLGLAGTF